MNNIRKAIALLLSLCLLAGATFALAEAAGATQTATDAATGDVTQAVATTAKALEDGDIVATVNGSDITGAEVKAQYQSLINDYGAPDSSTEDLYYAVAMEQAITMKLFTLTAAQTGLDQFTDEELAAVYAQSDSDWQAALDGYVQNAGITDASTAEEKAAAYAEAETYYGGMGYSKDQLRANYKEYQTYDRVQQMICKDIAVTDEQVQAQYEANITADQAIYADDADAYETQLTMVQYGYATEKPWYHPNGYRYIKHILIPVDSTLLSAYTDLQARLEEQMEAETDVADATATEAVATDTPDPSATPDPTQTPVTQADLDNAKADILTSIQDKTAEIYDKIAAGEDFDALIAQYGVNADGTASDPGMTSGSYPKGYEVSLASKGFVPEFVEAAFSVDAVGDVSAPYISSYGVHIVKYVEDVPAGPVELTDVLKETIRAGLQTDQENVAMNAWRDAATVVYTGILKSIDQVQSAGDTADEPDTAATEAPVATEAPAATETTNP